MIAPRTLPDDVSATGAVWSFMSPPVVRCHSRTMPRLSGGCRGPGQGRGSTGLVDRRQPASMPEPKQETVGHVKSPDHPEGASIRNSGPRAFQAGCHAGAAARSWRIAGRDDVYFD